MARLRVIQRYLEGVCGALGWMDHCCDTAGYFLLVLCFLLCFPPPYYFLSQYWPSCGVGRFVPRTSSPPPKSRVGMHVLLSPCALCVGPVRQPQQCLCVQDEGVQCPVPPGSLSAFFKTRTASRASGTAFGGLVCVTEGQEEEKQVDSTIFLLDFQLLMRNL